VVGSTEDPHWTLQPARVFSTNRSTVCGPATISVSSRTLQSRRAGDRSSFPDEREMWRWHGSWEQRWGAENIGAVVDEHPDASCSRHSWKWNEIQADSATSIGSGGNGGESLKKGKHPLTYHYR